MDRREASSRHNEANWREHWLEAPRVADDDDLAATTGGCKSRPRSRAARGRESEREREGGRGREGERRARRGGRGSVRGTDSRTTTWEKRRRRRRTCRAEFERRGSETGASAKPAAPGWTSPNVSTTATRPMKMNVRSRRTTRIGVCDGVPTRREEREGHGPQERSVRPGDDERRRDGRGAQGEPAWSGSRCRMALRTVHPTDSAPRTRSPRVASRESETQHQRGEVHDGRSPELKHGEGRARPCPFPSAERRRAGTTSTARAVRGSRPSSYITAERATRGCQRRRDDARGGRGEEGGQHAMLGTKRGWRGGGGRARLMRTVESGREEGGWAGGPVPRQAGAPVGARRSVEGAREAPGSARSCRTPAGRGGDEKSGRTLVC